MIGFLDIASAGWVNIPVNQPEVSLEPGSSLEICNFSLKPGQSFVPTLFLHFVGYDTLGGLEKISSGLPLVYAAICLNSKTTSSLRVGLEVPGVSSLPRPEVSIAGQYSVTVTNNSSSANLFLIATGAILLKNYHG